MPFYGTIDHEDFFEELEKKLNKEDNNMIIDRVKTTELDKIRNGVPFTWGKVTKIHEIGPYHIVEYVDRENVTLYHVYVDGKSTNNSSRTLDGALLIAIDRNNNRENCRVYPGPAYYAAKILGVKED